MLLLLLSCKLLLLVELLWLSNQSGAAPRGLPSLLSVKYQRLAKTNGNPAESKKFGKYWQKVICESLQNFSAALSHNKSAV